MRHYFYDRIILTFFLLGSFLGLASQQVVAENSSTEEQTGLTLTLYENQYPLPGPFKGRLMITSVPVAFPYKQTKIPLLENEEQTKIPMIDPSLISYVSISDDRADKSIPWTLYAKASSLTSGEEAVEGNCMLRFSAPQAFDGFFFDPTMEQIALPSKDNLTPWVSNQRKVTLSESDGFQVMLPTNGQSVPVLSGAQQANETAARYGVGLSIISNHLILKNLTPETMEGIYKGTVSWKLEEDHISLTVRDSTIYTTDRVWTPEDNFVSVKNQSNKEIPFSEVSVQGTVDTKTPGTYKVTYSYGGESEVATITVKADKASIKATNLTIYQNDPWDHSYAFVSATDKDGATVPFSSVTVTGTVNPSVVRNYTLTYTYGKKSVNVIISVLAGNTVLPRTQLLDNGYQRVYVDTAHYSPNGLIRGGRLTYETYNDPHNLIGISSNVIISNVTIGLPTTIPYALIYNEIVIFNLWKNQLIYPGNQWIDPIWQLSMDTYYLYIYK